MYMCGGNTYLVLGQRRLVGSRSRLRSTASVTASTSTNGLIPAYLTDQRKGDPGDRNGLGDRTNPEDRSALTPAEVGRSQDRRTLLVRTVSRPWIDKVDDYLRPMIHLRRRRCSLDDGWHHTSLLERREGEMTSDPLSRKLSEEAKRTCYNSDTRHITFVQPDQAAAASWHGDP
ncbi:unnamed protein product [Peronospora effusa]|nr:unnamed protein product [Peronospora effusa]